MQTLGKKSIVSVLWGERANMEAFHASYNNKVVDCLPCSQVHWCAGLYLQFNQDENEVIAFRK